MDRTGFVARENLAEAERHAVLGAFPRRSAWPDLDALNGEIGELQQRLSAAQARTASLLSERVGAPECDADARGAWELCGRRGPKPKPTTAALDEQIAEAQLDADALQRAVGVKLEEKGTYVQKHRRRLANVADQQRNAALERYLAIVDMLEPARATLVELAAAAVWARVYPDAAAAGEVSTSTIAGGRAQPITELLGLKPAPALPAARVIELLRRDAQLLATAMTPEQRKLIGGDDTKPRDGAVWAGSAAAQEQSRKERQAAREAGIPEYGPLA
ncbi:MAG: hypothetical protein H0V26_00400 [Solirubrobacterales bacterium]|nr:hypothetical protein [Solirubrobacterales bacterium]